MAVLGGISILQFSLYGICEVISKMHVKSPKQIIFTIFGKHIGSKVSPVNEIPLDSVQVIKGKPIKGEATQEILGNQRTKGPDSVPETQSQSIQ